MLNTTTYTGLRLKPPPRKAWIAGCGKARARYGGSIMPDGDWRPFIPPYEAQSRPGFDPQSCALIHTARAYIALAGLLGFSVPPDASERYLGALAGTTEAGTDPYDVAEAIRTLIGLIPSEVMPWTDQTTFPTFYDRRMAKLNMPLGQALLDNYEFGFEYLWPFNSTLTPEEKAAKIAEHITRGPICVSVSGNYRFKRGRLYKKPGERDTHWTLLGRLEEMSDSYAPQVKKLAKHYDHDAAMVYFLKRKSPSQRGFWATLITDAMRRWRAMMLPV